MDAYGLKRIFFTNKIIGFIIIAKVDGQFHQKSSQISIKKFLNQFLGQLFNLTLVFAFFKHFPGATLKNFLQK
jgi:hypothetical protein